MWDDEEMCRELFRIGSPDIVILACQAAEARQQLEAELQAAQQQRRASGGAPSADGRHSASDAAMQQLSPRVPSPQEGTARRVKAAERVVWCKPA